MYSVVDPNDTEAKENEKMFFKKMTADTCTDLTYKLHYDNFEARLIIQLEDNSELVLPLTSFFVTEYVLNMSLKKKITLVIDTMMSEKWMTMIAANRHIDVFISNVKTNKLVLDIDYNNLNGMHMMRILIKMLSNTFNKELIIQSPQMKHAKHRPFQARDLLQTIDEWVMRTTTMRHNINWEWLGKYEDVVISLWSTLHTPVANRTLLPPGAKDAMNYIVILPD